MDPGSWAVTIALLSVGLTVFFSMTNLALRHISWNKLEDDDRKLIKSLLRFPDTIKSAAKSFEPQRLTIYLENLGATFHSYYNKNKVLDFENMDRMDLRLHIIKCLQTVIKNGLRLLGVEAPEQM